MEDEHDQEHMENVVLKAFNVTKIIRKWEEKAGVRIRITSWRLESLETRKHFLEDAYAQSEARNQCLQQENEALKRDYENCRNTALLNSCGSVTFAQHSQLLIQSLQKQLDDEKEKNSTVKSELGQLKAENQRLHHDVSKRAEESLKQSREFQNECSILGQDRATARERCLKLQHEIDRLNDRHASEEREHDATRRQSEEYARELSNAIMESKTHKTERDEAMRERFIYKQQRDDAVNLSATYQQERDDAMEEASQYKRERDNERDIRYMRLDLGYDDGRSSDNSAATSPLVHADYLGDIDLWSLHGPETTEIQDADIPRVEEPVELRSADSRGHSLLPSRHLHTSAARGLHTPCRHREFAHSPQSSAGYDYAWGGQAEEQQDRRSAAIHGHLYVNQPDRNYKSNSTELLSVPSAQVQNRMTYSPRPSSAS